MRKDKELAIKLRHSGKSYNEITRTLKVSKSTLSLWFRNDPVSQKLKLSLNQSVNTYRIKRLVEANRERWNKWRESARQEAIKEFTELSKNHLFVAGLMLYWAEGDNNAKNPVKITNTAPAMIKLYIKFLVNILKIPSHTLRVGLIIYPDLSKRKCLNFWSEISGVPKGQFYKTQVIKGRHPTKRLSNGICMITCGNRQLKEKFLVWIDLLSKKL